MKSVLVLALVLVVSGLTRAEDTPAAQQGKLSSVRLLSVERTSVEKSPDGLAFHFLVAPTPAGTGQFTLKETRDFLFGGTSYQQMTRARLGKVFEASTTIDEASDFLAKRPDLRAAAPRSVKGALVMSVAIGGAALPDDGTAEVTLNVGYDRQVEPFRFKIAIPPLRPGSR